MLIRGWDWSIVYEGIVCLTCIQRPLTRDWGTAGTGPEVLDTRFRYALASGSIIQTLLELSYSMCGDLLEAIHTLWLWAFVYLWYLYWSVFSLASIHEGSPGAWAVYSGFCHKTWAIPDVVLRHWLSDLGVPAITLSHFVVLYLGCTFCPVALLVLARLEDVSVGHHPPFSSGSFMVPFSFEISLVPWSWEWHPVIPLLCILARGGTDF